MNTNERRRLAHRHNHPLYMPLEACPEGHVAPRYTITDQCTACLGARRRSVAREEARAAGLTIYTAEVPCINGHENPRRYVKNNICLACHAIARSPPMPPARLAALQKRHRTYVADEPCKNGHTSRIRYAKSGLCKECQQRAPHLLKARRLAMQYNLPVYASKHICINGHAQRIYWTQSNLCRDCYPDPSFAKETT